MGEIMLKELRVKWVALGFFTRRARKKTHAEGYGGRLFF